MKLAIDSRLCPFCGQGKLEVRALHKGVECPHCHKFVEVNFLYSAGIPVLLTVFLLLFLEIGWNIAGYVLTFTLVVFTAGYRSVFAAYLPLKHYDDVL